LAGTGTTGALYAFDKGKEAYVQHTTGLTPIQQKNLKKLDDLNKYYGGKDPFD
jgi:hypothetical protein